MFNAVVDMQFAYILCGVIWAVALGFAAGNYACSLVHRLPRGQLLLDKKPYCGNCGTLLQVKDLFPVISALLLRHKCRYCHVPFPVSHTWTELLVGLLFVMTFLAHGFSEQFLLIVVIGIFLITLAAIEANEGLIMGKILLCIVVFGMLYRTLEDKTIYNFFLGALDGFFLSAIIWRKQIKPAGHIFTLPTPMLLVTIGCLCVGNHALPIFLLLFATFYWTEWFVRKLFQANKKSLMTVSFGLAVIILVLYPLLFVISA